MLNFMRKHTNIIMVIVILFFVLSCFAGYGLYTRGGRGDGGMRDYAVAEVEGKQIMRSELERAAQQMAAQYGRDITSADAAIIRRAALNDIVVGAEVDKEIANRKIDVSKDEIDAEYKRVMDSYPTREEFAEYLKRTGLTEAQVKESIKKQLQMRKFFKSIEDGIKLDDKEVQSFYDATKAFLFTRPAGFTVNMAAFINKSDAEAAHKELSEGASWDSVIEKYRASLEMATSYDNPVFIPEQAAEKELKILKDYPLDKLTPVESGDPTHPYIAIKRSVEKERTVPFSEASGDAAAALRTQKLRQEQQVLFDNLLKSADLKILDESIFPKIDAPAADAASGDAKAE
ncbi:MAG: SurA N-terminal domain-containing protein [Synergistes sp.]|nr:SurA N-terminal domain-containing protein [Synergistes sp.]